MSADSSESNIDESILISKMPSDPPSKPFFDKWWTITSLSIEGPDQDIQELKPWPKVMSQADDEVIRRLEIQLEAFETV